MKYQKSTNRCRSITKDTLAEVKDSAYDKSQFAFCYFNVQSRRLNALERRESGI